MANSKKNVKKVQKQSSEVQTINLSRELNAKLKRYKADHKLGSAEKTIAYLLENIEG